MAINIKKGTGWYIGHSLVRRPGTPIKKTDRQPGIPLKKGAVRQPGAPIKRGTGYRGHSLRVRDKEDIALQMQKQKLEEYIKHHPNDIKVRIQLAQLREVLSRYCSKFNISSV